MSALNKTAFLTQQALLRIKAQGETLKPPPQSSLSHPDQIAPLHDAPTKQGLTRIDFFDFFADYFRSSYLLDTDGNYYPRLDHGLDLTKFERNNTNDGQEIYLSSTEMNAICAYIKEQGLEIYTTGIQRIEVLENKIKARKKLDKEQLPTAAARSEAIKPLLDQLNKETEKIFRMTEASNLLMTAVTQNKRFQFTASDDEQLKRIADAIGIFNHQLAQTVMASHLQKHSTDNFIQGLNSLAHLAKDKVPHHVTNNAVIALAEEHTKDSPAREELEILFSQLKDRFIFGVELPPNYSKDQMTGTMNLEEEHRVFEEITTILQNIVEQDFATFEIIRFASWLQDRSHIDGNLAAIPPNIARMNQAAYDSGIEIFGFDCPDGNSKNRAIMILRKLVERDKYLSEEEAQRILDYLEDLQNKVMIARNHYSAELLAAKAQQGDKHLITLSGSAHIIEDGEVDSGDLIPAILAAKNIPTVSVAIDHEDKRSPSINSNFFSGMLNRFPQAFQKPRLIFETHYPIGRYTSLLKHNNADAYWAFPHAQQT